MCVYVYMALRGEVKCHLGDILQSRTGRFEVVIWRRHLRYLAFLVCLQLLFVLCALYSTKVPKVKNTKRTVLGDKVGRIHMEKQNLDKMGGKKIAALRSAASGDNSTAGSRAHSSPNLLSARGPISKEKKKRPASAISGGAGREGDHQGKRKRSRE